MTPRPEPLAEGEIARIDRLPRSRPDPANRLDIIDNRRVLAALRKRNKPLFAQRDRKIRRLRASGISLAAIGARFDISAVRVCRICRGRSR
jgi:hypothetical protein